jgi:hypothetical protein
MRMRRGRASVGGGRERRRLCARKDSLVPGAARVGRAIVVHPTNYGQDTTALISDVTTWNIAKNLCHVA